jgi:hypothetical protein
VVQGERPELVDEEGTPLLTISTLRHLHVAPEDVLRGLFLGGFRDDPDVRKEVEQRTGWTIGGGRGYLVNMQVMEQMGLDGYRLAKEAHEDELDEFRARGGTELEFVIMVIAVSCVKLLSAHNSTQHTSRKHKV